jgi:hypothetical protein
MGNADPDAIVTASLVVNSNINFNNYPYPAFQAGFSAGASLFDLSTCGSNVPGPCGPYNPQTTFIISASSPTITVSTYFDAQVYNFSCFTGPQGCLPTTTLPDPADPLPAETTSNEWDGVRRGARTRNTRTTSSTTTV